MARRRGSKDSGLGAAILIVLGIIIYIVNSVISFVSENIELFMTIGIILIIAGIAVFVRNIVIKKQRNDLLKEILTDLHLNNIDSLLCQHDDEAIVKSKQSLNNYSDLQYFKETNAFEIVRKRSDNRKVIRNTLVSFLKDNDYKSRPQYDYVESQLNNYKELANGYRVLVTYITPAGNNRGERTLNIPASRIDEIAAHPEYLMTKGEYNKLLKQQSKEALDSQKHLFYDRVNEIVEYANNSKDSLIIKKQAQQLDELMLKLFDRTVNSIQKIKTTDSDEWSMINNYITDIDSQIHKIVQDNQQISEYYESNEFAQIKETCNLLTQSRKEFNEYINEKAQSITQLFGTRIVRNETQHEDVNNYIRPYQKTITPFTAEVSSAVFGSAENNPIDYVIKYFYPNKSQYKVQIKKLRILIEELETLKEAKEIIDNYKKDYDQYIQNVPDYVLNNDEDGFYSRLGLAIIDEGVLNVEYKFIYTSNGGMAQRSFTIPMTEETITELIYQLESKLSLEALAKEQRALMTSKLRTHIKERDNYTCCQCGNSVHTEPNLLLEIDHIIPISKGGLTQIDNLQTLCWKCNRSKGAKLASEF